ncbi:hypothetical protein ACHWQZ_G005491 [Mnemiopsis leidyi]
MVRVRVTVGHDVLGQDNGNLMIIAGLTLDQLWLRVNMKYFMILALLILTVQSFSLEKRDTEEAQLASEKLSEEADLDEESVLAKRNADVVALEKRQPAPTVYCVSMDFSVDLLNTMEKKMTSEIQKVLKAVNVSCASEVSESALMKLNKNPLAQIVNSLVSLIEQNVELCKCAAGKMDQLKSDKIADQKLLIELQKNQINSVQETVKSEMKSWADVVKKNVNLNQRNAKPLTENSVKQAVRAVHEEKKRSKNLMIYGYQEKEKEADFEVTKTVKEVLNDIDIYPAPHIHEAYRIGKKEQGKNRPIKVELESADDVDIALRRARYLKDSDRFQHVYIGPDRTKENQLAHNELVKQMKHMIERDPSKHYFIRQKKICSVDKDLSSQTPGGV